MIYYMKIKNWINVADEQKLNICRIPSTGSPLRIEGGGGARFNNLFVYCIYSQLCQCIKYITRCGYWIHNTCKTPLNVSKLVVPTFCSMFFKRDQQWCRLYTLCWCQVVRLCVASSNIIGSTILDEVNWTRLNDLEAKSSATNIRYIGLSKIHPHTVIYIVLISR